MTIEGSGVARISINGGVADVESTQSVDDSVWHCIVGTYDRDSIKIYVDGTLEAKTEYSAAITYSPEPRNTIGGDGDGGYDFFDGAIDELMIFDTALTICQVEAFCTIDTGWIGHYRFHGNTKDESGLANDATNNGAALTSGQTGVSNTAYLFDGTNDDMSITGYSGMSPTQAVSVLTWIRVDEAPNTRTYVYDRIQSNDGFGISIESSGAPRMIINGGQADAEGSTSIVDSSWHCVVGTYDRSTVRLYVDGTEVDNNSFTSAITYSPEPRNKIGGNGTGSSNFFEGAIDELSIYESALTDCQIKFLCGFGGNGSRPSVTNSLPDMRVVSKAYVNGGRLIISSSIQQPHVQVINQMGQIMFEDLNYQDSWSVSALSKGIYYYRIMNNDGHHVSTGSFAVTH